MTHQIKELRQLILKAHLMNEDEVISSWGKSSKITIENRISAQKRAKNLIKTKTGNINIFLFIKSMNQSVEVFWKKSAKNKIIVISQKTDTLEIATEKRILIFLFFVLVNFDTKNISFKISLNLFIFYIFLKAILIIVLTLYS